MATTRKLVGRVSVGGRWYGPDDDVPADVAEKITNPKAWTRELDEGEAETGVTLAKAGTPAGAKLASPVAVNGVWYRPGDVIPADIAERITNPKAWEGGKLPTAAAAVQETPTTASGEVDSGAEGQPAAEPDDGAEGELAAEPDDGAEVDTADADVKTPRKPAGRRGGQ